jgi:hypothetical protein
MKKTEFETLEELQRVYPIGSIFSTSIEKERWYCPSEKDIKAAISMWGEENVTILNEDTIVVTKKFNTYVQGYLFDGEYWRPRAMDGMAGMSWKKRTKTKYNLKAEYCKNNNIKIKYIYYKRNYDLKWEDLGMEEFDVL